MLFFFLFHAAVLNHEISIQRIHQENQNQSKPRFFLLKFSVSGNLETITKLLSFLSVTH